MKTRILLLLSFLIISIASFAQSGNVSIATDVNNQCAPMTVNFTASAPSGAYHYYWSYQDISTGTWLSEYSTSSTFAATYATSGYNSYVYVDVYDVNWNYVGYSYVNISTRGSQPFINASQQAVCPNTEMNFWTYYGYSNYTWDFGDGTILNNAQNYVNHQFSATGLYTVKVKYANDCGGYDSTSMEISVENNLHSPVQINPSSYSVCPGANVNFNSGFNANTYFWDFGDGTTASGNSYVNHIFADAGSYNVKLVTTNGCGIADSTTVEIAVNSNSSFPTNIQLNSKERICPGERFNMYTDWGYKQYEFNFGDGFNYVSSNSSSNQHTYQTPGVYSLSVKITNFCGQDTTIYKTLEVTNNITPGSQGFGAQVTQQTCPGSPISLSAWGDIKKFVWDMGETVADTTYSHWYNYTYNTPGIKGIIVTLTNYCGLDTTILLTTDINSNTPVQNANANVYPNVACPGERVSFNANAEGSNEYFIVLSTNLTDTIHTPYYNTSNITTPGTYDVYFGIRNLCGYDTVITKSFTISGDKRINNNVSLYLPNAYCVDSRVEICPPWGYKNYSWSFGNGNTDFSAANQCVDQNYSAAGNYTVSVSFENTCGFDTTISNSITIVNSKPFDEINLNGEPSVCPGDEWSGGVSLSSADYANATYSWSFGDGTTLNTTRSYIDHVYDLAGTYTATVSVDNGCGADSTVSMIVAVGLNNEVNPNDVWVYPSSNISCPNTLLNFRASDGYQKYFWDFGNGDTLTTSSSQINKSFANAGNYRLKVRVYNGCNKSVLKTADFVISNNAQVQGLYIAPIQGDICPGDVVFFRGDNDGPGSSASGLTYSWFYGDNQSGFSYTNSSYHAYADTGLYNVNVIAYNTCGDSATYSMQVDVRTGGQPEFVGFDGGSAILIPNYEGGSVGCPGDAITMLYLGEFATNNFTFGDGTSSPSTGELDVNGYKFHSVTHIYDAPGTYWVYLTVSNACGVSITDSLQITIGNTTSQSVVEVFALPSKKPEGYTTCIPVELLLMGAQTYVIDFGDGITSTTTSPNVTHSYANAGFYHISVEGTNGCGVTSLSATDIIVNNGGTLTTNANTNAPSCFNGSNGSISIDVEDGIAPYSYEWRNYTENNSNTLTGLSAGTYYLSVSDSVGCLKDLVITLNNAPEITVSQVNSTRPDCQATNGSIEVAAANGNGSYTYSWSTGVTGNTISGIASGLYDVLVTDASGCSKTSSFSLVDNNGPAIAVDSMFSLLKVCKGGNDANIEIGVTGGTQPYTYTWSNGSSSPNQSNLEEGVYELTVNDNGGCKATAQISIDAYPAIFTEVNVTRNPDCKQANGEVTFDVRGGSGSFELSLDGNVLSANTATGVNAGQHTLIITDLSSFCTEDTVFYIDNAGTLDFAITKKNPKCYGSTDGLISITPSGGTPSYYSIVTSPVYNSPKSTKVLFNNLGEATYRIQVEDKVGCIVNQLVTLNSPDSLSLSYTNLSAYCGNNNGTVTGLVNGGTTPYSVAFTGKPNQSGSAFNFSNLSGGNYTLTVTDSNFCQKSKSIVIATESANFNSDVTVTPSLCNRPQGTASVSVSGGYAPYTYTWNVVNPIIAETVANLSPGTYSVIINDNRGCSETVNFGIDTTIVAPGICLVTVDTVTEKNLVVWEKPLGANLQSFNVYKEGSVQNQFDLLGNVPVNQLSEFIDVTSDTRSHKDRYRISGVDSCGNESDLSAIHETIHLSISAGTGSDWNLLWNNYDGLPIGSYTIWRSTDSVNYSFLATRPAAVSPQFNTYTDVTAPNGLVFYKVSFDAPYDCNSEIFRLGNPDQVMRTYRKVKSNVGSNRMANPNATKALLNNKLEVYPNPNNGNFTIEFGYFDSPVLVEITNQLGQTVKKIDLSEVKGNQVDVNFTNFDTGVYFVHFVSDNSNITKRIIKY